MILKSNFEPQSIELDKQLSYKELSNESPNDY